MPIKKLGSPEKISKISKTAKQFEEDKEEISKKNDLVRCTCGKLLSKVDKVSGKKTLQHRGLQAISGKDFLTVKCPVCSEVVEIK